MQAWLVTQGIRAKLDAGFGRRRDTLKLKGWQRARTTRAEQQVVQRMHLGAIGPASAWRFVMAFFGWRALRHRRELAALAGWVGSPYNSGEAEQDQGISKAGNRRLRRHGVLLDGARLITSRGQGAAPRRLLSDSESIGEATLVGDT